MKTLILTLLVGLIVVQIAPAQQTPTPATEEISIQELAQKIINAPAKKFLLTIELKPSGFYDREVTFEVDGIRYNVSVIKQAVNGGKSISFYWQKKNTAAIGRCIDSDGDGNVDFCRALDGRLYEQVVEGDGIMVVSHTDYHKKHDLQPLSKAVAQAIFASRLEVIKKFVQD